MNDGDPVTFGVLVAYTLLPLDRLFGLSVAGITQVFNCGYILWTLCKLGYYGIKVYERH